MKLLKVAIDVEIGDDVDVNEVVDWIAGHMDNIPSEMLEEMDVNPDEVSVGIVYADKIETLTSTESDDDEDE
jgi:hypothetical protein